MGVDQEAPSPFGTGAIESPPDERDWPISKLFEEKGIEVSALVLPSTYVVPNRPPVLNQGSTPQCVAYSTSSMKSYQDYDDQATRKFWNFDEPYFFRLIGGTSHGAVLRNALSRLLYYGYPVVGGVSPASAHKIRAYYAVAKAQYDIKAAIFQFGEIVLATNWYDSWFHPVNGVLPRPNYSVGGHAIVADGWDSRGLRLRNSWGTAWGISGECWMPWSYALAAWEFWKAYDQ